jgi:hypothetical protein
MFRTAALLIAVALLGGPTGKAICDVWCLTGGSAGAMTHSACHDAHEGSAPGVKSLAADACDSLIVAGPFVPERVQRPNGGLSVTLVASAPLLVAHPVQRATLAQRDPDHTRAGTPTPLRI